MTAQIDINVILKLMIEKKASDLHLRVMVPPVFRIDGVITLQVEFPALSNEDLQGVFETVASPEQRATFAKELELDFAYSLAGVARFRVNVMRQRGTLGFVFRAVPFGVPNIDALGLPPLCKELILKPRGLLLVTGPTGSGKSTTMAAMVEYLNETVAKNVVTIEDPIEFLFKNKKCIIAQRDLGDDTKGFDIALRHALRQDPNVILVGEMRDLATISTAIRAAETGHLVMGTLHSTDASQTVERVVDVFPPDQQAQIRLQLSQVLEGILSQVLLPKTVGKGRVSAIEILVATPAVRNLIREGKTYELPSVMQMSSQVGMQTLNQALAELVKNKTVNLDDALVKSSNPDQLKRMLQPQYGAPAGAPAGVKR